MSPCSFWHTEQFCHIFTPVDQLLCSILHKNGPTTYNEHFTAYNIMALVCAGWLHEVQRVLCTAFWSMDRTGVYACLFEAVCDVTTVPSHLNPIPTRGGGTLCPPGGGGGGTLCPPQVHFLKYLRNALSYGLETFWQFKWIELKNKNLFFNRLRPPLVTIATFKVDACFWKRISAVFMPKLTRTRCFLLLPWRMAEL